MTQIKIDKGIPIQGIRYNKYPFEGLEKGDSFFIPAQDDKRREMQQKFSGLCTYYKRKLKRKFKALAVKGGVRIWRIK